MDTEIEEKMDTETEEQEIPDDSEDVIERIQKKLESYEGMISLLYPPPAAAKLRKEFFESLGGKE